MQFDEVLDSIGGFRCYQKWVLFLICVLGLFEGFIYMNPVFLLGIPEHRCAIPGYANDTYEVQDKHHAQLISAYIPMSEDDPKVYDKCYTYTPSNGTNMDWSSPNTNNLTRFQCNKWVYDRSVYQETFVSQMNLVCDKQILTANAGMVFFLGMMIGSLLGGIISDRFGRKTSLVGALCLLTVASTANAWANSYAMFVTMQILKGGSAITTYVSAFVLIVEITGKETRHLMGPALVQSYTIGVLVLSGIAYCLQHWFWIQLVSGLPGVLFISYWWSVCSFVYFGLSLNSGSLSGNLYLNFALLAVVEIPAYAIVMLLVDKIGRRKLYFLSMLVAGLACLSTLLTTNFAPDTGVLTVILALVGKLGNSSGFSTMYIYSAELFPTVARNAGMGSASLCARVGSMVAPYLVVFGNNIGGSVGTVLPFVLFGGASVLSALLVLLLPETAKKNLPENVQEGVRDEQTKSGVI